MFRGKFRDRDVPMMLFGLTLFLDHVALPFLVTEIVLLTDEGEKMKRKKNFFNHQGDLKLCELEQ